MKIEELKRGDLVFSYRERGRAMRVSSVEPGIDYPVGLKLYKLGPMDVFVRGDIVPYTEEEAKLFLKAEEDRATEGRLKYEFLRLEKEFLLQEEEREAQREKEAITHREERRRYNEWVKNRAKNS